MTLDTFYKKIKLPIQAIDKLNNLYINEKEFLENINLYFENTSLFYKKILKYENFRIMFLYYYCNIALKTYNTYNKKNINDKIFFDTFYDLTIWCNNCYNDFNEYGIDEYKWFYKHLNCKIFRLGRLQYEITKNNDIYVHIPQGEKLDLDKVIESFNQAKTFFNDNKTFICHSWLLYPSLKYLLPKNSNILKFQNLFNIKSIDYDNNNAEKWIFGKIRNDKKKYKETNFLQKEAKKYLLSGNTIGRAIGIYKY